MILHPLVRAFQRVIGYKLESASMRSPVDAIAAMGGTRNPGYTSGQWSNRDPDFPTQGLGPNLAAERGNLSAVRARSYFLRDNNELIDGGIDTLVSKVVGRGIGVNPATSSKSLNAKLCMVRDRAFAAVDPERTSNIAESQEEFYNEVLVGGECGVYFPFVEEFNGHPAGPAIELFESAQVDLQVNGRVPEGEPGGGNRVRQGIEYDAKMRRTAFWVYVEQPNDGDGFGFSAGFPSILSPSVSASNKSLRRLTTREAWLCFRRRRKGQLRGIPRVTSAMRSLRSEDGYVDNVMLLMQLISSLGVYFGVDQPSLFKKVINGKQQDNLAVDAQGNPILTLRGSQIIFVPKGSEPKIVNMQGVPGPQFEQVIRSMQRRVSRILGIGYNQLSGDSSQDNFSSQRGNELDNRDKQEQDAWLIYRRHTYPYYTRSIRAELLSGELVITAEERAEIAKDGPDGLIKAVPSFSGREYVNPAQEAAADEAQVRTGTKSRAEIIRARGADPSQVIREEAEYDAEVERKRKELGLGPRTPSSSVGMAGNLGGGKSREEDDRDEEDTTDEDDAAMAWSPRDVRITDAGRRFLEVAMRLESTGGDRRGENGGENG